MVDKVTRGQVVTFMAAPTNYLGDDVSPDTIDLYLNYKHSDGTLSTDEPLSMFKQTDGNWVVEFDTSDVLPGVMFASFRATNPAGAEDLRIIVVANAANPNP